MTSIYQHFRKDEKEFIDNVIGWREYVENSYSPKVTDFLDPRQQHILKAVIGTNNDIKISFYPELAAVERKRAILYPGYYEPSDSDYAVTLYEIEYPKKFVTLEHRQILGSLMSLGLKREKFGDILMDGDRIQLMTASEIGDYVDMNFNEAGRSKIALQKVPFENMITSSEEWREVITTASSLRLDVILSALYNISRQKVQTLITGGAVKVNWRVIEAAAFEVGEGDVFSMRGFGRSKLLSIEGKTKKDKIRIAAGILK
ncbi:RNA-binding protein [Rossellomorea vietnamensis]|uniref:RNA-binding protein n=1 Tax=Rossellomorea vietnamensis TaxID=218284 RepID=A0A5D4KJX1_9BACI|nr:RNA-binding protein [Rossellomorea vietnamensis]TYR77597.1 RNA-binding protein [Rossellomorea vietnamensis]